MYAKYRFPLKYTIADYNGEPNPNNPVVILRYPVIVPIEGAVLFELCEPGDIFGCACARECFCMRIQKSGRIINVLMVAAFWHSLSRVVASASLA